VNEQQAREILGGSITPTGDLYNASCYVLWDRFVPETVTLDDEFTIDQLEAIVWWMRNKSEKQESKR